MGFFSRIAAPFRTGLRPRCVRQAGAQLGENPVWSIKEQALYWIDVQAGVLHRHTPPRDDNCAWQVGQEIHALALDAQGRPLLGVDDRLLRFDTQTRSLVEIARFADLDPACRLNDCACDQTGRLWIGSMDRKGDRPLARLYCIDAAGRVAARLDGFTICNGPAFAANGQRLYIADSPRRMIYTMDIRPDGSLAAKRQFVQFATDEGFPDGMTVDAQDHLWVAHYDGGKVSRFSPNGDRVASIRLPVARVTSCTFGGEDIKTLYVTSARAGLTQEQLRRQPDAGGLFAITTDIAGRPANLCAL
jgi:sugar lactone lactonase YvrE